MKRVLIESPYAGNVQTNLAYCRAAIRDSLLKGEAPFAPHAFYTQPGVLNDDVLEEREMGIEAGLQIGFTCEVTAVYGDLGISKEMKRGIERAKSEGRPVEYRSLPGWGRSLIGIAGKKRSGKDTLAALFEEMGYVKTPFVKPLKDASRIIFGFDDEQLYGEDKETPDPFWGFSPRLALQVLGTEACRDAFGDAMVRKGIWTQEESEDIWVKAALKAAETQPQTVISDVRFHNEAEAIMRRGGHLFVLKRASVENSGDPHASEDMSFVSAIKKAYPDQVTMVMNDGSINDLHTRIRLYWNNSTGTT